MNTEAQQKVADVFEKLRRRCSNDLQQDEAAKLLVTISSLYGTLIDISVDAQMAYNRKYEGEASRLEKITEARVVAKASDEYEHRLRWEAKVDVCKELINSLKYLLKVKLDERRDSSY